MRYIHSERALSLSLEPYITFMGKYDNGASLREDGLSVRTILIFFISIPLFYPGTKYLVCVCVYFISLNEKLKVYDFYLMQSG